MNSIIIQMMINSLQFLIVTFLSFFSIILTPDKRVVNKMNIVLPIEEVNYIVKEKNDIPTNKKQEIVKEKEESKPVIEKQEEISQKKDVYVGKLTGYGPDCYGCSGLGNLACKTKIGEKYSLVNNGIYYNDETYGKVRILSAATAFPCGTIMEIIKDGYSPYYGVVLDRGFSMNQAWSSGTMFVDLAYEKNALAGSDNLTGQNIIFKIVRYGW